MVVIYGTWSLAIQPFALIFLSESTLGLLPECWILCLVTPLLFILQSGLFDNSFISSHDINWQ